MSIWNCKHHYLYRNVYAYKNKAHYRMVSECIHCGMCQEIKISEREYLEYIAIDAKKGQSS